MTWHQHERETLAALLLSVGPDAPTLCEGWRSRHLAVHLLHRESAALSHLRAVPGPVGRVGAEAFDAVVERCLDPEEYAATIDEFAQAPAAWSPWGFAGDSVNLLEFFVHGEDVRGARPLRGRNHIVQDHRPLGELRYGERPLTPGHREPAAAGHREPASARPRRGAEPNRRN